jgi:cell division protein FtsZ
MIHFDLPKQKSSIIKVLGVGGGGSNAVNFMHAQDIEGVDFIICNTDAKAIEQSKVLNKIQLGPHLTQGLGAGANPEVGKAATEESLQEIKSILEVNTKMAFITAGMGGGTGTGGAPIVAKMCKELGILTVGIVTTPFGFEGPRRMQQAEEGIRQLKPFVDTLLVISNDKLRMQYGNLKMKEAFYKADNVLATAAKCITDIINSRGHIIVDLGKAEVEGENRASRAIEEALSSPLLNDNDITGAKWILININSAEGDDECTMDEVEIINNYLRMQAGENTDVIVGMGYDNTLDKKVGITLIATGFEHKDPFAKPVAVKKPEPKVEKIVMTLGLEGEEKKLTEQPVQQTLSLIPADPFAPHLKNELSDEEIISIFSASELDTLSYPQSKDMLDAKGDEVLHFELSTEITGEVYNVKSVEKDHKANESATEPSLNDFKLSEKPAPVQLSHSFLSKPSQIYAQNEKQQPIVEVEPAKIKEAPARPPVAEEPVFEMKMTEKDESVEEVKFEINEKTEVVQPQTPINLNHSCIDEAEDQRKRAAERIQKLRNLSFNMNTADPNSEFDSVPAYIRRNLELFGNSTLTTAENFYSKYTVGKDENDNTHISTINTFLDGKKPD